MASPRPVLLDVRGEVAERREDAVVPLVVGAQLDAVGLRDGQRDLEGVDGVEAEPLVEERRLGLDGLGRHLEREGGDDEARHLELLREERRGGRVGRGGGSAVGHRVLVDLSEGAVPMAVLVAFRAGYQSLGGRGQESRHRGAAAPPRRQSDGSAAEATAASDRYSAKDRPPTSVALSSERNSGLPLFVAPEKASSRPPSVADRRPVTGTR